MAKLAAYRAKRDFKQTSEPQGGDADGEGGSAYVVQKHAASRLHYDLRLELDGVMKSWAVAKGPSLIAGEKRLAVHVEDHPIAYNAFEGTIPKGQYGGGTVMIWDRGTWQPEGDVHKGYAKGHLNFQLAGEKLTGSWHLVRMHKRPGEKHEPWLLIKAEDAYSRDAAAIDLLDEKPLSIATGRSLEAIAGAEDGAVWNSNKGLAAEGRAGEASTSVERGAAPKKTPAAKETPAPKRVGAKKKPAAATSMPDNVEPCLAKLVSEVPHGGEWLHEIKWDGYRLIAFRTSGNGKPATRLVTRNGHDWTGRFPAIASAIDALAVENAIFDGEAVVEDEHGVSSFSALQDALSGTTRGVAQAAVFYAFDLLYLDGEDLRALPLEKRKAQLAGLVAPETRATLRLSEHVEADGGAMLRSACGLGLEGVISKRRDRPYRAGRGDDWTKTKCTQRQEFVIGGYVPVASGSRSGVGSLALGTFEGAKFVYAGRTGTGFSAEVARDLARQARPITTKASPFADRLTSDERRGVVYMQPTLVAEVEFRGWTTDGRVRQASFRGLREDKSPTEVVREVVADAEPDGGQESRTPSTQAKPPTRPKLSTHLKPHPRTGAPGGGAVAGVALTHPDRVLWPDAGVTKHGLAEFYERIGAWLLPHVIDRPLSLVRCPAGADAHCFFQKHSWAGLSDHIRRESVRDEGGEEEVLFVEDMAGIVSLVQSGVLEIHPWGAKIGAVDRPDRITIDLDPGDGVAWPDVIAAAFEVRGRLARDGLESFVKTTGGKGLHVVVPLDGRADWVAVKGYAKTLADAMERDDGARYLAKSTKAARRGRIYVDYLRNGRGATAVAAYSTRARAGATCSVPVAWEELTARIAPNHFTILNLPARLDSLKADPWADLAQVRQDLPNSSIRGRSRN